MSSSERSTLSSKSINKSIFLGNNNEACHIIRCFDIRIRTAKNNTLQGQTAMIMNKSFFSGSKSKCFFFVKENKA